MNIREGTLDDVKAISYIHALSWKSAYQGIVPQTYLDELKEDFWVSAFTGWIKENVLGVQIVTDHGSSVGCVAYGRSRDKSLPNWGEIVSLYLLPEYFGKGYGKKLLESALMDFKKSDYQNIYLWVLKENQRARRFYENNGLQCNNDECVCEIMGKELTDIRYVYSFTIPTKEGV